MRRNAIAAFGIAIGVFSGIVEGAPQSDPNIKRVEAGLLPVAAKKIGLTANINDRMRAYGVPGLSIAVIDNGRIAWAKGYGVTDLTAAKLSDLWKSCLQIRNDR